MRKKQSLCKAVGFALNGMKYFFLRERNGQIQAVVTVVVMSLGFCTGVNITEACLLLLCCGVVLCAEIINCAIERLCDMVQEEYHPVIKIVKDVAAASVLMVSVVSIAIGGFILLPKIYYWLC